MSTPGGQYYYQSQQQDMANYVRPPETVFSAVQYYPMATIKPCAPVVHDVPFLSISHGDYTLTDPTDAEYSFYNSLLDNANPQLSGGSNLLVRQQYDIAREMLMNSGGAMASIRLKPPLTLLPPPPLGSQAPPPPPPHLLQHAPLAQGVTSVCTGNETFMSTAGAKQHPRPPTHPDTMQHLLHFKQTILRSRSETLHRQQQAQQEQQYANAYAQIQQPVYPQDPPAQSWVNPLQRRQASAPSPMYATDPRQDYSSYSPSPQGFVNPAMIMQQRPASPAEQTPTSPAQTPTSPAQTPTSPAQTPAHLTRSPVQPHPMTAKPAQRAQYEYAYQPQHLIHPADTHQHVHSQSPAPVTPAPTATPSQPQAHPRQSQSTYPAGSNKLKLDSDSSTSTSLSGYSSSPQSTPAAPLQQHQQDQPQNPISPTKLRKGSLVMVVEIPAPPWRKKIRSEEEEDDETERERAAKRRRSSKEDPENRTRQKEGDAALLKLTDFLDSIFEAEDTLTPDTSSGAVSSGPGTSHSYFLAGTSDPPLLSTPTLRRLILLVRKCADYDRVEDVPPEDLQRVMKMMESAVREAECLEIVPGGATGAAPVAATAGKTAKSGVKKKKPGKKVARGKGKKKAKVKHRRRGSVESGSPASSVEWGSDEDGEGEGEGEDDEEDEDEEEEEQEEEKEKEGNRTHGGATLGAGGEGKWVEGLDGKVEKVANALEAASAAFEIMTAGKLPKQLYPEGLITSSLNLAKYQLESTVYPVMEVGANKDADELNAGNSEIQSFLSHLDAHPRLKRSFTALPVLLNAFLHKVYELMQHQDLSDSVVVIIGFLALGPFFVDTSGSTSHALFAGTGTGHATPEQLKLEALNLLRAVFTNHPTQRSWILEEILMSLIKLPMAKRSLRQYRLPDGKTIQMVSALILQLVQSCAEGVTELVEEEAGRDERWREREGEEKSRKGEKEVWEHGKWANYLQAWKSGFDAAGYNANYVLRYLLLRCTRTTTKSSTGMESDYRTILDNLMEDVVAVLNYPEWPAAEMVIRIFSRLMITNIDDPKADNTSKAMAIDYLGMIAGRLKKFAALLDPALGDDRKDADAQGQSPKEGGWFAKVRKNLVRGEVTTSIDVNALTSLWRCQSKVLEFLERGAQHDPGLKCAHQLLLCEWGIAFASALVPVDDDGGDDNVSLETKEKLRTIVKEYWTLSSGGRLDKRAVDDILPFDMDRADILQITELLASRQSLFHSLDSMLSRILVSLNTIVVAFRTKALRALGLIVVNDPSVLGQEKVHNTIKQRFQDSSSAVRDAAIDLVGKYLTQKPEITKQYYPVISERILDTGINVRKRVIKLLRDIYFKSDERSMMVDIVCKLANRVNDEDNNVKDLALRTLQEILFVPFRGQKHQEIYYEYDENDDSIEGHRGEFARMSTLEKKEVQARSMVVVGVLQALLNSSGSADILEEMIKKTLEKADGKQKRVVMGICQCMVDCLIDQLLTLDEREKSDAISKAIMGCINAILIFSRAGPNLLVGNNHVKTLKPYLMGERTSEDELRTLRCVLMIYRNVLPLLKRPDPTFLQEVEKALTDLLLHPKIGTQILEAVLPCLCVVVEKLTFNYIKLIKLLKNLTDKLREEKFNVQKKKNLASAKTVVRFMIILALLCQHFDFDKRRMELPDKVGDLDIVYKGVVSTWVFELCLFFGINDTSSDANTNKTVRMVSLQSLGHLYLSYPTLMVHPESTNFMDRIFDGDSDSMRIELMKVYLQFLAGESERMKLDDMKKENDTVDLRVLIGNAEEFAEAGVSSSLMQRYLNRILSAALDEDRTLRVLAFDVVGNIVRQGLAHPVLCMPTIVAMETSPENSMRDKAYRLHVHLNEKHASLMHTRNVECVSKAYAYQKQVAKGQVVRGYAIRTSESKPEALLNTMYILMRDKRQKRNDFLLQILKTFEFQFKKGSRENVDLDFQRFIADNVATFDYKYLDEVLYGIYVIHRVMSVTGMNLHAFLERRALKTTNGATDEGTVAAVQQNCIASEVGLPGGSEERNKMVKNSESQSGDEGEKEDDDALVLEQDDIQLDLPVAAKLSVSMSILMLLRDHLKRSYTLNEVKCRQYNPNQANAQKDKDKDKPAARNPNISTIISWEEKLPFAEKPITFEADMEATCQRFRTQMAEDGTARDDYGDDSMELMSNNEGGSAFEDFDGLNVNGSVAGPAKTPTNRLRTKTGLMKKLRNTPKKSGVAAKGAKPKGASKARTKKSSVEDGDEEEWRASGALVGRIDFGSGGAGGGSHGTTTPKKRRRSIQLAVVESGSEEEMDPGDDDPDWRG